MKNVLKLVVLSGCAFLASRTFGNPLMALSSALGDNDHYKIEWQGTPGTELYGGYAISSTTNFKAPTKVEQVKATLPHQIEFNAPKHSMVSASAMAANGQVTVRIYKNGAECGTEAFTGSGAMPNKICQ